MNDPGVPRYGALALQVTTHPVGHLADPAEARLQIGRNIARVAGLIGGSLGFVAESSGLPVRLVVLPEYALTGAPTPGAFAAWRAKAALAVDGAEYAALGAIAHEHALYLAGNAYEADPAFPDLYFQACFIIGPSGDVRLRYRRLVSLYSPSPYDVLQRYLDRHGPGALFPVADTDIGRLAAVASEEILYPEIARCHVMRGAEVLVHSTSEMGSPRPTAKDIAKRARAAENLAYVVSANTAGVVNTALPAQSSTGMAKIVDYEGRILAAAAAGGESLAAHATIDLAALRARRRQPGLTNVLARQPFQAYAESYRSTLFHAAGQLEAAGTTAETATLRETQLRDIERLAGLGLI
ncbi:MAG: nitrilase [Gammaproteobacteria bacterium]|nr:nitrilase [Gammaproteobacteria bacterium]